MIRITNHSKYTLFKGAQHFQEVRNTIREHVLKRLLNKQPSSIFIKMIALDHSFSPLQDMQQV